MLKFVAGTALALCLGLGCANAEAGVYQATFSGNFIDANNFGDSIAAGDAYSGVVTFDPALLPYFYSNSTPGVASGYAQTNQSPTTDPNAATITVTDLRTGAIVSIVSNYYAEVTARIGLDPNWGVSTLGWQTYIQQDNAYSGADIYIEAPVGQFSASQFAVNPGNPTDVTLGLGPSALNGQDYAIGSLLVYQGGSTFATAGFTINQILAGSVSAVPEPATWAMMLIGFGMIDLVGRRRLSAARTTA